MTPQRSGHAANSTQARYLTVRRSPAASTIDLFGQSVRPCSFGRRSLAFLLGRTPRENTLYGLLGVRADADDETIKEAFRKAVKAYHPDLHAGDPHAPLLFRQIVAANGILRDAQQRAIYDRFLEGERQQLRSRRRRAIASDVISVAVVAVVLLGGYALLFAPVITTRTAVAEKDKHTVTDAIVLKEDEDAPKVVAPVGEDKRDPGGQAEMAAGEPAAQTGTTDKDEAGYEHGQLDVPNRMPATAAAAVDHSAAQAIVGDAAPVGFVSNDPKFYREQGILWYRRGDFHLAIVDFDQAIRLDTNDAQAYDLRGNAFDEIGDFDRALADYEEAIRIDPSNPAIFRDRAILWRRKGELDRALVDLDRAIRFSFSDADIYSDRGLVWYEKGRRDRAIADFNRAVKLDPNFAVAYISRGLILHRSGELSVAVAGVDKGIRVDPQMLDAIQNANVRY